MTRRRHGERAMREHNCDRYVDYRQGRAYHAVLLPKPNWFTRRFPKLVKVPRAYCAKCSRDLPHFDKRYYRTGR